MKIYWRELLQEVKDVTNSSFECSSRQRERRKTHLDSSEVEGVTFLEGELEEYWSYSSGGLDSNPSEFWKNNQLNLKFIGSNLSVHFSS